MWGSRHAPTIGTVRTVHAETGERGAPLGSVREPRRTGPFRFATRRGRRRHGESAATWVAGSATPSIPHHADGVRASTPSRNNKKRRGRHRRVGPAVHPPFPSPSRQPTGARRRDRRCRPSPCPVLRTVLLQPWAAAPVGRQPQRRIPPLGTKRDWRAPRVDNCCRSAPCTVDGSVTRFTADDGGPRQPPGACTGGGVGLPQRKLRGALVGDGDAVGRRGGSVGAACGLTPVPGARKGWGRRPRERR